MAGLPIVLHLTPSTISHQIKELEEYFGRALFPRRNRKVEPTPEALRLLASLSRAFDVVEAACAEVQPLTAHGRYWSVNRTETGRAAVAGVAAVTEKLFASLLELTQSRSSSNLDFRSSSLEFGCRMSGERHFRWAFS
jgi:DNA-binding MarR family transcriptional regulator